MPQKNSGYTPQTIRNRNYQVIINLLRESKTCSIRQLVLHSALSKTAVKRILDNLMEAGMVELAGKGKASEAGGKRPELYTLCSNQAYAVSCIVSDSGFYIALLDLKLQEVDTVNQLSTFHRASYSQIIRRLAEAILQLLNEHPDAEAHLACVSFASPGIISYAEGALINPIPNSHWGKHLSFLSDIRALLPLSCPFYFDNLLRFDSYYQQTIVPALRDSNALIINYFNNSIGGSVLRGRHLVHGHFGLAGEFGHIITDYSFSETCSCGKTGCIESVVSHGKVVARAERELHNWPTSILNGRKLTFTSISNAADVGDVFAQRQMDFVIQQFTMLVYNLQIAIDPDVLLLKCYTDHAPMRYFSSKITEAVNQLSLANSPVPIQIDVNQNATDISAIFSGMVLGQALFGFDQLFNTESSFNEFIANRIGAARSEGK